MVTLKFLCLLFVSAVFADRATYHNYQVHRVVPENQEQLKVLKELEDDPNGLSFWVGPSRIQKAVDIMVPSHMLPRFNEILASLSLKSEVYISNVQHLIDTERPKVRPRADFGWTDYYTLDEIYAWLDSLVEKYPGVVTPIVGGESYEGRQIRGVKVSYKTGNPGVALEGGIHAREWISSATATYILNKLLTSEDPVIKDLAQSFDYYVFPVTNPDGYVYTHTTDRTWRKTRSQSNSACYGADPNRNWDFHWMEAGASSSPCSDSYAGASPFSEIETRTLANYLRSISDTLLVYLDFHSYSQLLMFPYGHSQDHVSNYDVLYPLGLEAAAALAKNNGTRYEVGSIYDAIYPASGGSIDWVRGVLDTPYSYVWELRDTGRYGFLLPASQIIDTAEETLSSAVVILSHAKSNLRVNKKQ
ncbi:zinc carboxypeptidase-like isoform X2 [Zootermopsis nevadensis]|nr:zinc carboxypeptidase-like isoform X2 [Zootermopsis nevadensis]XP_021942857.1 zinc carboxypeptidase-like isoform X2 [Zootermopsis nevadensis]